MHLEIITPEMKIYTGEATAVQFPGMDGLFQVLNDHAPIISALKAGTVKVNLVNSFEETEKTPDTITVEAQDNRVIHVEIKGGVMEMQNNKIIVLAE